MDDNYDEFGNYIGPELGSSDDDSESVEEEEEVQDDEGEMMDEVRSLLHRVCLLYKITQCLHPRLSPYMEYDRIMISEVWIIAVIYIYLFIYLFTRIYHASILSFYSLFVFSCTRKAG